MGGGSKASEVAEAVRRAVERLVEVTPGWLSHSIFGFVGAVSGLGLEFTVAYVVYQLLDVLGGEDPRETCVDIVEYCAGMFIGALVLALA